MTAKYYKLALIPILESCYKEFVFVEKANEKVLIDGDGYKLTAAVEKDVKLGFLYKFEGKDVSKCSPAFSLIKGIIRKNLLEDNKDVTEQDVEEAAMSFFVIRDILDNISI